MSALFFKPRSVIQRNFIGSFYTKRRYEEQDGIPVECFLTVIVPLIVIHCVVYTTICVPLFLSNHWMASAVSPLRLLQWCEK